MKTTMKPQEIVSRLEGLGKIVSAEEKFCEVKAEAKFPATVALAIAKNRKILENEFCFLQEQQRKNEIIAEKSGRELMDLPEQKEFLETEIEIEVQSVSQADIEKCKEMTSTDYYNLMFMVE